MKKILHMLLFFLLGFVYFCAEKNHSVPNESTDVDLNQYELSLEKAEKFALMALTGVETEFPYKTGHVFENEEDLFLPKELHLAFYGCFDWHSAVHGHWLLVSLLKQFSGQLTLEDSIRNVLNRHLSKENIIKEAEYFHRPNSKSFERTYGWAWLLKLQEELYDWKDSDGQTWFENLKPLTEIIVNRYIAFFPKQTYPIRRGVHPNTAFGLAFAHDFAVTCGHKELLDVLEERAKFYFMNDKNYPVEWETEGDSFLSSSLMEAFLMARILPEKEFRLWFHDFLPGFFNPQNHSLKEPAIVTDRTDPKLVHLDGLNLSRCWGFIKIAQSCDEKEKKMIAEFIKKHLDYSLSAVNSDHYEGSHWLATFAVYALNDIQSFSRSIE